MAVMQVMHRREWRKRRCRLKQQIVGAVVVHLGSRVAFSCARNGSDVHVSLLSAVRLERTASTEVLPAILVSFLQVCFLPASPAA